MAYNATVIDTNEVRARLDAVIAAMKESDVWGIERPADDAFVDVGAFGARSMAFEQWLRWVFVPNVETLIASNGPWPTGSAVAAQAAREGDTNPPVAALVPVLHAFDALFEKPAPPAIVEALAPPSSAAVMYERGRAAFERGDHRAALGAMREALKLDPRFPNAHNYAGWILLHWPSRSLAELDAAIAYFREAVLIAPQDDAPLANLCDALVAAGREEEAVRQAEQQSTSPERNRAAVAHNWLGWRAMSSPTTLEHAPTHFRAALQQRYGWGVARSNLAKALEMTGHADEAYDEHARALECKDAFNRAFSHERRGAYEARHGWLRNAVESFRLALREDRTRGAANEATYLETIAWLGRELRARGIDPDPADREAWARERELEIPAGFGARNEQGEPLAEDVIEVERLVRQERWADAVAALEALRGMDSSKLIDAIGYASVGAKRARRAGDLDSAIAMQAIVVDAYRIYASCASSGGEGMARMLDVDREQKKLDAWKAELHR